ncbi:MAG: EamA family transporter [Acidobacteriota bacterium]|nr:EamA family transporter [Acidobacteriota bacterium]
MKKIHPFDPAYLQSNVYLIPILVFQQSLGGLAYPIAKYGLSMIDPFTVAFYRFVISAIVLLGITRLRSPRPPIEKKDYWRIIGLGCLIIPFNQLMYLYGQSMTGAGHGAMLFATTPIWLFLAALVFFKEKFVWRRAVGVTLGLMGVAIIMAYGAIELGTKYLLGDLIILIAVFAWVAYTIFGRPLVIKYGAFRVTAYALSSGALLYFPFGLYHVLKFDYSKPTAGAWLAVLYLALGLSVAAYVLWYWLIKHIEATRIAVFQNVQPIIASVAAFLFLAEPLGWPFLIGGAVVLAGVFVTIK